MIVLDFAHKTGIGGVYPGVRVANRAVEIAG
jgi:hypothetical protein